jgi:hypothetical protein
MRRSAGPFGLDSGCRRATIDRGRFVGRVPSEARDSDVRRMKCSALNSRPLASYGWPDWWSHSFVTWDRTNGYQRIHSHAWQRGPSAGEVDRLCCSALRTMRPASRPPARSGSTAVCRCQPRSTPTAISAANAPEGANTPSPSTWLVGSAASVRVDSRTSLEHLDTRNHRTARDRNLPNGAGWSARWTRAGVDRHSRQVADRPHSDSD